MKAAVPTSPTEKSLGLFFCLHTTKPKELLMSFTHTVTAGFMPRDVYHQPTYRRFPKQKPILEVPRDRRS